MSDLFYNKVAAAILASALGVMCINKIANALVHTNSLDASEFAYSIAQEDTPDDQAIEIPFPSAEWIAAQDADKGKKVFKKCLSCHNVDAGGSNSTGPNLYEIVGRKMATREGFKYSSAMTAMTETWNYESLDAFLEKPSAYISKTNMPFIGLKKETDRAAIIEYLRLQAANPLPPLTEAAPIPGVNELEPEVDSEIDHIEDIVEDMVQNTQDVPHDNVNEHTEDEAH